MKVVQKGVVLVGNIGTNATEAAIREIFSATAGAVTAVSIPGGGKGGTNRGYALVEMKSDAEAEQALLDLSGVTIDGRCVTLSKEVQVVIPKKWYQF
jgi:RNA recognition motif-containing protein